MLFVFGRKPQLCYLDEGTMCVQANSLTLENLVHVDVKVVVKKLTQKASGPGSCQQGESPQAQVKPR